MNAPQQPPPLVAARADDTLASLHDAASAECLLQNDGSLHMNHHGSSNMYGDTGASYQPSLTFGASSHHHQQPQQPTPSAPNYMYHPRDHSVLLDHNGRPLTIDRMLGSQPLQSELATRPGPGNKRLVYLKGDAVTRLLNQVFGHDGWNLTILKSERLVPPGGEVVPSGAQQQTHKYHVAYMSHVRITLLPRRNHTSSSSSMHVFREDVGMGDATDRNFYQAAAHALKSSITDGVKRAARHFGDRLGNSLYDSQHFTFATAPKTQAESLDDWEKRWNQKYGDNHTGSASGRSDKDKLTTSQSCSGKYTAPATTVAKENTANHAQQQQQKNNSNYQSTKSAHQGSVAVQASVSSAPTSTMQSTTSAPASASNNNASVHPYVPPPQQHQQQQQQNRPSYPLAVNGPSITTNAGASFAVAPVQPPAKPAASYNQPHSALLQQQQPSPPATYWVRNSATTTMNGGTATALAPTLAGTTTQMKPCVSNTATTPSIQSTAASTSTTTTSFDFYDNAQRPSTSHGMNAHTQQHHHQVTPASSTMGPAFVNNNNKRPAPIDAINDPKKNKPASSIAMNPYGPR